MGAGVVKHEDVAYFKYDLVRVISHTKKNLIDEKSFYLNHWHEELEINYCMSSGHIFYIDGRRIQEEPGRLILVNSESIHSIVPDIHSVQDGEILGVTVLLHPKFLEENFPQYKDYFFVNDMADTRPEICDIMLKLSECSRWKEKHPNEYPFYVKGLLLQLLFYMGEEGMIRQGTVNKDRYRNVEKIKEILIYVKAHYREPLTQVDVAEYFSFTQQYFSYYFKKYVGKTFTDYLSYYRVQQAKKELERSDRRIMDIALENGFTEERRFTAAFKKYYNETPMQFRKRLSEAG